MRIKKILSATAVVVLASMGKISVAEQPLKIIVPFNAGGGSDTAVRVLDDRLSKELGRAVVVQNLAGASGIIGTRSLKQSDDDGSTIGISLGTTIGTGQIFNETVPYNYTTDFEYLGMIGQIPRGFFVSSDSKYQTMNDVILDNRGDKNFGITGKSPDLLNALIFNSDTNSNHQLIPYESNTNGMITDLLGGRLDGVWQSLPAMNLCLQNNSCRLLAVAGTVKHPDYSDVPSFNDLGLPNVNAPSYYGFITPKGVPVEVLQELNQKINATLADPSVKEGLLNVGIVALPATLEETRQIHFSAVDVAVQAKPLIDQDKK